MSASAEAEACETREWRAVSRFPGRRVRHDPFNDRPTAPLEIVNPSGLPQEFATLVRVDAKQNTKQEIAYG
jgi:hypothetical protein